MKDRFDIDQVIKILGLNIRADQADGGADFDVACNIARRKLWKMKKYEDLEEQGKLLLLHVGDTGEITKNTTANELIYRQQLKQYHMLDAESQWEQYREENDIQNVELEKSDYEALVEKFENTHDCNIADNVQWQNIIADYVRYKRNM